MNLAKFIFSCFKKGAINQKLVETNIWERGESSNRNFL